MAEHNENSRRPGLFFKTFIGALFIIFPGVLLICMVALIMGFSIPAESTPLLMTFLLAFILIAGLASCLTSLDLSIKKFGMQEKYSTTENEIGFWRINKRHAILLAVTTCAYAVFIFFEYGLLSPEAKETLLFLGLILGKVIGVLLSFAGLWYSSDALAVVAGKSVRDKEVRFSHVAFDFAILLLSAALLNIVTEDRQFVSGATVGMFIFIALLRASAMKDNNGDDE